MDVTSKEYNLYWDFCPYHEGESSRTGWTKYVTPDYSAFWSGTGSPDNKLVLDPKDDVAHEKMGGKWRMPTDDEWQELIDNCTWTSRSDGDDLFGRIVTSNVPGYTDKSIYLPAAGCRDRKSWYDADHYGCYWSSSLYPTWPSEAYGIFFTSGTVYGHYECGRYGGQSVRAVIDK